jgi:cyclophilin family peptidyl-prolyl cis-trans isomerase
MPIEVRMKIRLQLAVLSLLCIFAAPVGGFMNAVSNPVVIIDTSMGTIKVELFADKAPLTVKNFLSYVDKNHYDNTIFHRVIPDFMIQGGGFTTGMKQKATDPPIKNEATNGLSNTRGTIAMARTRDPDSATSQFFINVVDNSRKLDRAFVQDGVGYCVFGKVMEGMDVCDKIVAVETTNFGAHGDVPKSDVIIKSIRRAETKK